MLDDLTRDELDSAAGNAASEARQSLDDPIEVYGLAYLPRHEQPVADMLLDWEGAGYDLLGDEAPLQERVTSVLTHSKGQLADAVVIVQEIPDGYLAAAIAPHKREMGVSVQICADDVIYRYRPYSAADGHADVVQLMVAALTKAVTLHLA